MVAVLNDASKMEVCFLDRWVCPGRSSVSSDQVSVVMGTRAMFQVSTHAHTTYALMHTHTHAQLPGAQGLCPEAQGRACSCNFLYIMIIMASSSLHTLLHVRRFLELKEYVLKRRDELAPAGGYPSKDSKAMGAELSQEELLGLPAKKGFAKK